MGRNRFGQPGHAGIGEGNQNASSVGSSVGSANQAFIDQPRNATGHAGAGDEGPAGELRHAQLPAGEGQLDEHVVVGQGQTGLLLELCLELAHERGVSSQQRPPRPHPASAW